jgi:hypothetical protein
MPSSVFIGVPSDVQRLSYDILIIANNRSHRNGFSYPLLQRFTISSHIRQISVLQYPSNPFNTMQEEDTMEKFIPFEKLSKKEQRKINNARRNTWGPLNPVTRKTRNGKAYDRKKTQDWKHEAPDLRSFCLG